MIAGLSGPYNLRVDYGEGLGTGDGRVTAGRRLLGSPPRFTFALPLALFALVAPAWVLPLTFGLAFTLRLPFVFGRLLLALLAFVVALVFVFAFAFLFVFFGRFGLFSFRLSFAD